MVDIAAVANQVLTAIEQALPGAGAAQTAALTPIATDLATALADIESDRTNNNINDAAAQAFINSAAEAAQAALQAQLGIGKLDAKKAVIAALEVLASVALTAAGLGWAAPILNAVIAAL